MSKYCQKCGTENEDKAKKCVKCGKKFKKPWYKKVWVWILAAIMSISIVSCATSDGDTSSTNTTNSIAKETVVEKSDVSLKEVKEIETETKKAETPKYPEVSIEYIKRSPYLNTAFGKENASEGYEVIIAFIRVYNPTNKTIKSKFDSTTCYADGVQVGSIETYSKIYEDGIGQYYYDEIISGYSAISAQDFEVPLNWNTLTIFYNDEKFEFTQEDIKSEPFTLTYKNIPNIIPTEIGAELKGNNYTVVYDGFNTTKSDNQFDNDNYIRVMFTITNHGTESLKTSLMGHSMQMYQNGYLMPDANFATLEDYNGYKNIFSLDSVAPGMSAKIFIGFERQDLTTSEFTLVYNDGYILDNELGLIYIKE